MKCLPDNQCRRCGRTHDEFWQFVDPESNWAVSTVHCECGHSWTVIYTAPNNLAPLRSWIARGCRPPEGPPGIVKGAPWHPFRLEGVSPAVINAAS